ncbi:hypothetical protein PIB30_000876 [Stylosanthes scabra]|uniref:Uncharacterized protein n=1 Tax=Stylosanthes scabra TaxID=79078 RepID=A0ABU6R334_9FABA|nr:hypothetical protein [Stylosanthes scabra]
MYMAKNGNNMRHSIAIMLLTMGLIVCSSAIAESSNIIFEGYWVSSSSHHDNESLKKCIKECKVRHPLNHDKLKTCIMHCCVDECRRLAPRDREKFMNCLENLYATYLKNRRHNNDPGKQVDGSMTNPL